jgi:hypothetical protein
LCARKAKAGRQHRRRLLSLNRPPAFPPADALTMTEPLSSVVIAPLETVTASIIASPTLAVTDTLAALPTETPVALAPATPVLSPTGEAPAIITATVPVQATPQPTSSPSETLTVTVMPTVTQTPLPAKPPKGSVLAFAGTSNVITGQDVGVTLVAADDLPDNQMVVTLSEGLDFVAGSHPAARYDAASRTLLLPNTRASDVHTFQVRVLDSSRANSKAKPELTAGDAVLRFKLGKQAKPEKLGAGGGRWAMTGWGARPA